MRIGWVGLVISPSCAWSSTGWLTGVRKWASVRPRNFQRRARTGAGRRQLLALAGSNGCEDGARRGRPSWWVRPVRARRSRMQARLITLAKVTQATATATDEATEPSGRNPVTTDGPPAQKPRIPLRSLWPYLRPHRTILLIVSAISVVGAALSVAQPAMVALVISSVQEAKPLAGVVTLLVALVLATAVINGVQQFLLQRTAEAVVRDTRQLLVHRLVRLPISDFDTRRTGDLVSRVGSDTTLLRAVVTSGLVDAVSGVLVFVGSVIAMALISPSLLGLTLVVVAIAVAAVVGLGGRIQKLTLTAQTQVGQLAAAVARAIPGIRTIRAAGATDRETEVLAGLTVQAYQTGVGLAKVTR